MSGGEEDILPIEVPDDSQLFDQEPAPEAEEVKVEAETEAVPEEKPAKRDDGRDAGGRFSKKEEGDHRVPLRELLDERERRQQIQAQYNQVQQYLAQQQQAQQQQQQWPDIFENPEYYQQAIQQMQQWPQYVQNQVQSQVNKQLAVARHEFMGEMSIQKAKEAHPEDFQAAWGELEKRVQGGDNVWRHQILTSSDPGKTLLELHKRGGDPDVYVNKRLEELKKDPKFLAEILEAAQQHQSQSPRINMPSLTRAGGGSANNPVGINARDLWDEINK
jgi:type II secretory pathway pseudopilin PulG